MADKDLLVVISEMLPKQDQHTEILNRQSEILLGHTKLLVKQGETLETVSKSLTTLTDVSVEQFGQQQKFNEEFLKINKKIVERLDNVINLENRIKRLETAVFK